MNLVHTNILLKMFNDLKKFKKSKKPKNSEFLKSYNRSKGNCIAFKDVSLVRKNRHSHSFTININRNVLNRADKLLKVFATSRNATSCHDNAYHNSENTEIKKLKAKHRREMAYSK